MTETTRPPESVFLYEVCWRDDLEVDLNIQDAVNRINESGWVWTAESCAGHDEEPWTDPFLRLVVQRGRVGELLWLHQLVRSDIPVIDQPFLSFFPCPEGTEEWAVVLIRLSPRAERGRGPGLGFLNDLSARIFLAR